MSKLLTPDELQVLSDYGCSKEQVQTADDFFAVLIWAGEHAEISEPGWLKLRPGKLHREVSRFKHDRRSRVQRCLELLAGFAACEAEEETGGRPATVWYLDSGLTALTADLRMQILEKHLLVKFAKISDTVKPVRCPECQTAWLTAAAIKKENE